MPISVPVVIRMFLLLQETCFAGDLTSNFHSAKVPHQPCDREPVCTGVDREEVLNDAHKHGFSKNLIGFQVR